MSPINALIKDQVTKLRESGLRVCVLKDDRVDAVEVSVILSNPWKVYGGVPAGICSFRSACGQ